MSPAFFHHHRTGDLMAHATNDIQAVEQTAGDGVLTLVDALLMGGLVLFIMCTQYSLPLTLLALLPLPVMALYMHRFGNQIRITSYNVCYTKLLRSIFNLQQLRNHRLAVAVVQSDAQYQALHGEGEFAQQGPFDDLRSLFSLHPEPLTLVTRQDAGIAGLADLPGKRLDIGNPGSGDRSTMNALMQAMGWKDSDFSLISSLPGSERAQALCDGKIDAFVYVVGHPSGTIKEASSNCATTGWPSPWSSPIPSTRHCMVRANLPSRGPLMICAACSACIPNP